MCFARTFAASPAVGILQWAGTSPKSAPFPGDMDPIEYVVLWTHVSQHPKRHLERFSLFLHSLIEENQLLRKC